MNGDDIKALMQLILNREAERLLHEAKMMFPLGYEWYSEYGRPPFEPDTTVEGSISPIIEDTTRLIGTKELGD